MTVRGLLKAPVERVLSSRTVGRIARNRTRGRCLILAYHGIVPEGEGRVGESALFVTERDFAAQLDVIAAEADVVPLDELDSGSNGRPRVAITFDDAYRGAVDVGVRILAERRLPATIFVAPGRLDGHVFWWDALAHETLALDTSVRDHALSALGGMDERVRAWATSTHLHTADSLPGYARSASRDELHSAVSVPGITVGSHTWSHANLVSLTAAELAIEIERPLVWLRTEFGKKAIPWLAYPYGLDSDDVRRATCNARYVGAVRIGGGWHKAVDVSPFARPRFNVSAGLTQAGFRARLRGGIRT